MQLGQLRSLQFLEMLMSAFFSRVFAYSLGLKLQELREELFQISMVVKSIQLIVPFPPSDFFFLDCLPPLPLFFKSSGQTLKLLVVD